MKTLRPFLIFILLVLTLWCAWKIYQLEQDRRIAKEDLITLSNIKYGLFSVDEWKKLLSTILSKKIEELNFSPEQKADMRIKISNFLTQTIEDFESRFFEEKSKSILGILQGGIASLSGMFNKIKRDIPVFTDQILDFVSDQGNRDNIKGFVLEKLSEYTDKTFAEMDYTEHNEILMRHGYEDRAQTMAGLERRISQVRQSMEIYIILIFGLIILGGCIIGFAPNITRSEYLLFIALCLGLLWAGLLLPMIEIDARIEEMRFTLLGEEVFFVDQVLYYKSKSILEVVRVMLAQGKADVWVVGLLVLLFSVLFPVTKLISSVACIYRPKLRENGFFRFLVFRTGKWSMADVMVVAIFMAYIGFSGILTEQLRQLEDLTRTIDIVTTNKSSLQMGFFLFTGFAILSLLVSHRLQYEPGIEEKSAILP